MPLGSESAVNINGTYSDNITFSKQSKNMTSTPVAGHNLNGIGGKSSVRRNAEAESSINIPDQSSMHE